VPTPHLKDPTAGAQHLLQPRNDLLHDRDRRAAGDRSGSRPREVDAGFTPLFFEAGVATLLCNSIARHADQEDDRPRLDLIEGGRVADVFEGLPEINEGDKVALGALLGEVENARPVPDGLVGRSGTLLVGPHEQLSGAQGAVSAPGGQIRRFGGLVRPATGRFGPARALDDG